MIRVQLPDADVRRLEEAAARTADATFRDRMRIVLMAHRGRPHQGIATDLGVTPRTVQRWPNAYLAGGLDGLRPRKAKGKPRAIPAALAGEVKRWVVEGPARQGLGRANWTHEELAAHLRRARGIRTSRSAAQRFCGRIGVRPYRPTYRFLRADPAKQAAARGQLAELKKS